MRRELFYGVGVREIYINELRSGLNVGLGKDNRRSRGGGGVKL